MSAIDYPLLNRSEVPTPPAGFQFIFRDKGNGGYLTSKSNDCGFDVLQVNPVSQDALDCVCEITNKMTNDAGCAMIKGIITAEQYESIVDNFNFCVEVNVDPITGSQQICMTNSPTLFIALSLTDVLCNGGSTGTASVAITGGTAPFVVNWNGADETALAAGSYLVSVTDANNKTKAVTFIINEPPALSASSSSTAETALGANDGTATVVVSGGTAPYTYLWDDGLAQTTSTATGLAPNDYNCTVTDANGCVLVVGPITVNAF